MFRLNLMMAVMLMGVAGVLASTLATSTDPPPPTTTLTDEDTDTPTPTDTPEDRSNTTKEKGTNRVLNYGVVAGGAFGAYEYENDDYLRGYPYPPPQPPFLPGLNPGIPGLNPGIPGLNPGIPGLNPGIPGPIPVPSGPIQQGLLPPFPGAFIPTGSCKYYCPGRWNNRVYCCDSEYGDVCWFWGVIVSE